MRRLAVLALVLAPAIVSAQGRVRGEKKEDWSDVRGGANGLQLANKDVENISPIKLLIDKRKDLKLSDDQLKQVKDVESKLKEKNDGLFRILDSLRKDSKAPPAAAKDRGTQTEMAQEKAMEERTRMSKAIREAGSVVKEIRGNYDASLKDALALLDENQKKTADELLTKLNKDAEEMLADKMSMPGGGRRP
jgi:ribosomal protein L7/L12